MSSPTRPRGGIWGFQIRPFAAGVGFIAGPPAVQAQGLVKGVQRGAQAGNKAAGPVGGVLGGAIGGVVGVFTGVLGVGKGEQPPAAAKGAAAPKQSAAAKSAKAAKSGQVTKRAVLTQPGAPGLTAEQIVAQTDAN